MATKKRDVSQKKSASARRRRNGTTQDAARPVLNLLSNVRRVRESLADACGTGCDCGG